MDKQDDSRGFEAKGIQGDMPMLNRRKSLPLSLEVKTEILNVVDLDGENYCESEERLSLEKKSAARNGDMDKTGFLERFVAFIGNHFGIVLLVLASGGFAGLVSCAALIPEYYQMLSEVFKDEDAVVSQQSVDVFFLDSNQDMSRSLFPLYDDALDPNKTYHFDEHCLTQVIISNPRSEEINIIGIEFKADNISPDLRPVLNVVQSFAEDCQDPADGGMGALVFNTGWSDAENVVIVASCDDPAFEELFGSDRVEIPVSKIPVGESESVAFFMNRNLLSYPKEKKTFLVNLSAYADGWGDIPVSGEAYYLSVDSDGIVIAYGKGGPSDYVYGIYIDTCQSSVSIEEAVSESIKGGESLEIPICFFPDRSATLDFSVALKIRYPDGTIDMVSTPACSATFSVSSCGAPIEKDVKSMSSGELRELLLGVPAYFSVAVSYPYASLDAMYDRAKMEIERESELRIVAAL